MKGFTFKKQKRETGLRSVGYPHQDVNIKHNGKVVGHIRAPNWKTEDHKWGIMIALAERGDNFAWRTFKKRFDTEEDARQAILNNAEDIVGMGLHYFDDSYHCD